MCPEAKIIFMTELITEPHFQLKPIAWTNNYEYTLKNTLIITSLVSIVKCC